MAELQDKWGSPLIINSACRTKERNKAVGGAQTSLHLGTPTRPSTAFDIKMPGPLQDRFIKLARSVGFNGIGRGRGFVHIDIRPHDAYWEY